MSFNESTTTGQNTVLPSRLRILMDKVRSMRRWNNGINAVTFFLAFAIVLFFAVFAPALYFSKDGLGYALNLFLILLFCPFLFCLDFLFRFVLFFWPFILYFWAGVWTVRQRTLLSLIQASLETKTPLADMIRAYACDCYSAPFRKRLDRFAAILEQGYSLDQAIEWDRGLFRYDIIGMLRLGGGDPATLQSIEDSAKEERDYSSIRGMSIVRLAYFLSLILPLLLVVTFMMFAIAPKFETIFLDFDVELPVMTVWAITVSNYFVKYWYLLSPLVPVVVLLFVVFLIMQTNAVVWRPPFFRRMFRDADSAKLLRMQAVGLKHSVSIPDILQVYRRAVPSYYLQKKTWRMEKDIMTGRDWIESLKKQRFVNGPEASLLETAQRTGNTVAVLEQLAISKDRSQLRKDDLTSKLIFIPCLLALGLVIGLFVIAMFMPLIKLTTTLSSLI